MTPGHRCDSGRSPGRLSAATLGLAGHLPDSLWRPGAQLAGSVLARFPTAGVRRWRGNAQTMTGQRPSPAQTRRAVVSWMRTTVTSMQLSRWSGERIDATVDHDPAQLQALRRACRDRGALVALPHMGSWDLAGAWVARRGMPVTTVAEHLPEAEFRLFVRTRERLGMRVLGYREPGTVRHLVEDLSGHRLVCLVADRDLSGGGVPVGWATADGPVPGSMPAGPAHLAVLTGAALIGAACSYRGPDRMRIEFSPILEPAAGGTSRQRVGQLTERLAEWFSAQIRDQVCDWHMFQPFFPDPVIPGPVIPDNRAMHPDSAGTGQ